MFWRAQVVRYVQLAAGDVDTDMLQDAARQQSKEGAKAQSRGNGSGLYGAIAGREIYSRLKRSPVAFWIARQ